MVFKCLMFSSFRIWLTMTMVIMRSLYRCKNKVLTLSSCKDIVCLLQIILRWWGRSFQEYSFDYVRTLIAISSVFLNRRLYCSNACLRTPLMWGLPYSWAHKRQVFPKFIDLKKSRTEGFSERSLEWRYNNCAFSRRYNVCWHTLILKLWKHIVHQKEYYYLNRKYKHF